MGIRGNCLRRLDILVLAGGLGTRLRPVLGDRPKLLAPIGKQPYLAYLVSWLKSFGAQRMVLGLGYRADAIIAYLHDHPPQDVAIATIVEPQPLGTAGAVRFARNELHTDPVLVLNGDSFVDADLCQFLAQHRALGAPVTMLCTEVENAGRYGRVQIDAGHRIVGFAEKDVNFHGTAMINAGAYLISAGMLDTIAAGTAASIEREVFERLPPGTLGAYAGRFAFIDIGTPESLAQAHQVLGRQVPSKATRDQRP